MPQRRSKSRARTDHPWRSASAREEQPFGRSLLDGPHWYNTYRCADGRHVSIGSVEPKFYRELCDRLSLAADPAFAEKEDREAWPEQKRRFAALFATRSSDEWRALLEATDACFAPVLAPDEAADHEHMRAREVYLRDDGVLQARPAPRFSGTPAGRLGPIPRQGEHAEEILREWIAD